MKFILVTGRSLVQGETKERKFTEEYRRAVATCEIDPEDLASMGIQTGETVKLTTKAGSISLRAARSSQAPHRGILFVAYGPWINAIVSSETNSTGMPTLKGMEVEVEPAPGERIQQLEDLLKRKAGMIELG
ncbi:MAG: molybdopterin dinucleotide binding domain-containing protein [Thermoproteota archaeon]